MHEMSVGHLPVSQFWRLRGDNSPPRVIYLPALSLAEMFPVPGEATILH